MKLPKLDLRYIYVLFSFSLPWCCKIGISGNVSQRIAQIQRELSASMGFQVRVRCLIALPVMCAETTEARLHRMFHRLNRKNMPYHAGHSEHFWYLNILSGFGLYVFGGMAGLNVSAAHIGMVALIPVPLDFALFVLCFAFLEYCIAFGAMWVGFLIVRYFLF